MPRKKVTDSGSSVTKTKIAFAAMIAFFATSSLEIADFALELITDTVKQRHAKGKAVLAGRAANASSTTGTNATEAVNAATESAVGATVPARRKPGPAPGTRRKVAGEAATGTGQAGDAAQIGSTAGEMTDAAALPPQESVLDLDAQK